MGIRSTSFGAAAQIVETFLPARQSRPCVRSPKSSKQAVDVGAGTGALSRLLTDVALHVIAVDPDPNMRQVLAASVPGIVVLDGRDEALPVADNSVDGVVASSSWHWVDPAARLREAARVLHPGGTLAAMSSGPDPDGAIMRQAQAALANAEGDRALRGTVTGEFTPENLTLSVLDGFPFGDPEHRRFAWTLPLTADKLIGLLGTLSWIIIMDDDDREHVFDRARRLLPRLSRH